MKKGPQELPVEEEADIEKLIEAPMAAGAIDLEGWRSAAPGRRRREGLPCR